jgi:hypothetical protein
VSKLRKRIAAYDKEFFDLPLDIQIDLIIVPIIESILDSISAEKQMTYNQSSVTEVYNQVMSQYSFSEKSTIEEMKNAVLDVINNIENVLV